MDDKRSFPRLAEALPTMASALVESLKHDGEHDLAAHVAEARVYATCACEEDGCGSVELTAQRETPCPDYRAVLPDAVISLGICRERPVWIEDNFVIRSDDPTAQQRRAEYESLAGTIPAVMP